MAKKGTFQAWDGYLQLQVAVDDEGTEEQAPHEAMVTEFLKAVKKFQREFEKAHPPYKVGVMGVGTSRYRDP